MNTGRISELSPQDGLGWIILDDGSRVRFGATACKGFVPAVGMHVNVVSTAPGYGGVIKATQITLMPKAAPVQGTGRSNVAKLDALKIPVDGILRSIVERSDTDDAFHTDLTKMMFEIAPKRAAEIDCNAEGCFVIAMDGHGNAFALFLSENAPGTPWVYWDQEIDRLAFVAPDTLAFFSGLLAEREQRLKDPALVKRVRGVLEELGVALRPVHDADLFLEGQPAKWLPRGPLRR